MVLVCHCESGEAGLTNLILMVKLGSTEAMAWPEAGLLGSIPVNLDLPTNINMSFQQKSLHLTMSHPENMFLEIYLPLERN